jgi:methyl-accepting chemotaxis protein
MKEFKISTKLIVIFLSTCLVSFTLLTTISVISSGRALKRTTSEKLDAICEMRGKNISTFYENLKGDVALIAVRNFVKNTFFELKHYHDSLRTQPLDQFNISTPSYNSIYHKHREEFKQYLSFKGYSDMYIVCAAHGHIMFSVNKGSDLGENLTSGSLKNSPVGQCWKKAVETGNIAVSDLGRYAPVGNKPAQFLGVPVKNTDGETLCILMVQIPVQLINNIVSDTIGLGHTGSTYIVGSDNKLRSATRFDPEAALNKNADSNIVQRTFSGSGKYSAEPNVIRSSEKLQVTGLNWAIVAEVKRNEAIAPVNRLRFTLILVLLVIAAIITGVVWYFARNISRPIEQAASFANSISEGDLTVELEVKQHDEIGQLVFSLNNMKLHLKQTIGEMVSNADYLAEASLKLNASSQKLTQSTNDQAGSVEEICAAIEEMSGTTQENAQCAQQANSIAGMALENLKQRNSAVQSSAQAMTEIANKVSIINDIALQTNILALNAAVEAARAGTHGRGFAVVATEVRKLAEHSRIAAGDINALIRMGVETAENTRLQFEKIVPEIENTARLVQGISVATNEQANSIEQVSTSVMSLDIITQQNIVASDEMAESAAELLARAGKLKQMVAYFNVG